jgi:hypothetical protein
MIKQKLKKIPLLGPLIARCYKRIKGRAPFSSSRNYWESRYRRGGTSGAGSYHELAAFKAKVINEFVKRHAITDVIEFGCGDGHQLGFFQIANYTGYDVSETAVSLCQKKYHHDPAKQFRLMDDYQGEQATLVLSLDVIFHLVEEEVYEDYMQLLFAAAEKYVIIYASNREAHPGSGAAAHFKHRKFTDWITSNAPAFKLIQQIFNLFPFQGDERKGSVSDFYIFERTGSY